MDTQFVQQIIDIVFKGNMVFLSPILLILMTILFSDRLIDLIYSALDRKAGRRTRY